MSTTIYNSEQDNVGEVTYMTYDQYTEYKASCEHVIEQAEKASKLSKNPEFISIIMDGYFDQEPKRLAGLMVTGRLTKVQFDNCVEDLRSIGSLTSYLQDFIAKGNIAKDELKNLEIAWNEAIEADSKIKETN